ncbi:MAG: ADP-ribosylglycohydrolase family protein [Candidatus Vogelbacteria bacterium]|nr:ADP-ribosylglycohydrolase family protein [Candidatus Vogelbacteria bacterium]
MKYPNPNMLLYIGIGDAYAMATEYIKLPRDQALLNEVLKFEKYHQHPTHLDVLPGYYTDDTEMSVANALVLIENEPPYTPLMFANAWVREFVRGGMRKGYSRKFQEFLERTKTGAEFLANVNPNSNKNGAAMRAVPFGVLRTVPEVLEVSTMQAKITHNTPEGLFSARVVALMSHYALYEKPASYLFESSLIGTRDYCLLNLPKEDLEKYGYIFDLKNHWDTAVVGNDRQSVAISTVHAVVSFIATYSPPNLRLLLSRIIEMGGDTDSVAAIVLGLVGGRMEDEVRRICNNTSRFPDFMAINLEHGNPKTGAKYLLDVGTQLMDKFK